MTIIDGYLESYNEKTKIDKTALTAEIVRILKASGVRFLSKEEHGVWMDASNDAARDKVSHMFRYQRRKSDSSASSVATSKGAVRDTVSSDGSVPDLMSNESAKKSRH